VAVYEAPAVLRLLWADPQYMPEHLALWSLKRFGLVWVPYIALAFRKSGLRMGAQASAFYPSGEARRLESW